MVDQIRVLVSGAKAMPSRYIDDRGRLRMDALQSFLRQGATLSLTDIGRVVPAIGELAAATERALRVRCGDLIDCSNVLDPGVSEIGSNSGSLRRRRISHFPRLVAHRVEGAGCSRTAFRSRSRELCRAPDWMRPCRLA